jgi:hypothetical protein
MPPVALAWLVAAPGVVVALESALAAPPLPPVPLAPGNWEP